MTTIPSTLLDGAAVFLGGGVGACCRYGVSRFVAGHYGGAFPLATFIINATGSALLGFALGVPLLHGYGGLGLALLGTGVLGSYTTFSTAALETTLLLRDGRRAQAAWAWIGSSGLGVLSAAAGLGLAAVLWPGGA